MKKYLSLILILIAAFILNGCTTQTAEASSAAAAQPGTVKTAGLIAEGRLQPVNSLDQSFSQPGQIAEVLVKDGQTVTLGQALARLAGSPDANLALARAKQEILAAQQALAALNDNLAQERARVQQTLAAAQQALKDAQDARYRKNLARVAQTTIDQVQSDLIIAQDVLKRAKEDYEKVETKPEDDLQRAQLFSKLAAAQQKVDSIQYNLDWLLSRPDTLEVQQVEADIIVAQAKVDAAKRDYDKLKNGPDPDLLASAQARLAAAEAAQASAQSAIDGLTLKATLAGTVIDLSAQPGQRVAAGAPVLTLADFSNWVVNTDNLTESDVTAISLGQKVEVVLDVLPDTPLTGEVTHINTRFEQKRGDITYTVTVQLTKTDPRMRWGMTAAVKFAH
jgi:HlyD family secretion protein